MRVVVKLGGSLLTESDLLHRMVSQLVELHDHGHKVIVVHGGGKQIKQVLEKLSLPSQFHQGLRITDAETMQVVQMVLAGWVNKEIVASFFREGRQAVGICGGDGASFLARKFRGSDGLDPFDYGFVGEVQEGDSRLLELLMERDYFPIIACTALGKDGLYYNINADEMASAAAILCKADRLVFLTDVPGIYDENRRVIPRLSWSRLGELRQSGVINEGMLPKTRACERAKSAGIGKVHILGGKEEDGLIRVLLQGEDLGTLID
ncbi:MAG: acetylglutamate kinase [Terriglobia bacterium]